MARAMRTFHRSKGFRMKPKTNYPLCGTCRYYMSFAEDIDRGQHTSCIAIAWPRAARRQRAFIRNPFKFQKEH